MFITRSVGKSVLLFRSESGAKYIFTSNDVFVFAVIDVVFAVIDVVFAVVVIVVVVVAVVIVVVVAVCSLS